SHILQIITVCSLEEDLTLGTINRLKRLWNRKNRENQQQTTNNLGQIFTTQLHKNEQIINEKLGSSDDVIITKFNLKVKENKQLNASLIAIDGLIDEDI